MQTTEKEVTMSTTPPTPVSPTETSVGVSANTSESPLIDGGADDDLFYTPPPTQLNNSGGGGRAVGGDLIVDSYSRIIQPVTKTMHWPGQIVFNVQCSRQHYMSPVLELCYTFKLTKHGDFRNIELTDNAAVIHLFGLNAFSDVEISLNSIPIQSYGHMLPQVNTLKKTLSTSAQYKKDVLSSTELWHPDSEGMAQFIGALNQGREDRKRLSLDGKLCSVHCQLPNVLAESNRLLLPNSDLRIVLSHSSDPYRIHAEGEETKYHILFTECFLIGTFYSLKPSLSATIERRLANGQEATYNFTRLVCHGPISLPIGNQSFSQNLGTCRKPVAVVVCFTKATCDTNYADNPMQFFHHNLSRLQFQYDGKSYPEFELSALDFPQAPEPTNKTLMWFHRLLELSGFRANQDSCSMDMTAFQNGGTFLAIPLEPQQIQYHSGLEVSTRPAVGNASISLTMEQATTEPINMYIIGMFNDNVKVSSFGAVSRSYVPASWG
jgi:hypothetical protein